MSGLTEFGECIYKLTEIKQQRDQYKNERNTLIDDVAILKANNERLIRRNQKLEAYVRMWDKVKDLRKELLEITPNHQLLIGLGLYMNELERDMYKGRDK